MPRAPAILLMGPTGAGKTDLAVELVARLPLEIVSVDAAMVFRGMDIGTAKPSPELLARAPHHLIDLIDPADSYSAARFLADAGRRCGESRRAGGTPLLVGGTMLYFRALQSGLAKPAGGGSRAVRGGSRHAQRPRAGRPCMRSSPRSIRRRRVRIRPGDRQRIQRALEVDRADRPADVGAARRGPARRDAGRGPLRSCSRPPIARRFTSALALRFDDDAAAGPARRRSQALRARGTCTPNCLRCA